MSFSFDADAEMQDLERLPAKLAKTANSAASAGGTGGKLAALAALATSHSQNAKFEGLDFALEPPPTGTFPEIQERCGDASAEPDDGRRNMDLLPPLSPAAETFPDALPFAAGALWWRVAITEPGGRTVEIDAPSGYILADWKAYGDRYHGPGCAVTTIAGLPKPRAPANLDEALRAACDGVAGITPAQFRALLSPKDVADIAAGAIHPKTLKAYAQSFAEGIRSGRLVPAVAP